MAVMSRVVIRKFPLQSPLCGVPLGNSVLGLLVWGAGNKLQITIGCATLWDHRGGLHWTQKQSYQNIFSALKSKDERQIQTLFTSSSKRTPEYPDSPSLIPVGRLSLQLAEKCRLQQIQQYLKDGLTRVTFLHVMKKRGFLDIYLGMRHHRLAFSLLFQREDIVKWEVIPSFDLCPSLKAIGFKPPQKTTSSFIQPMPADIAFGVCCRERNDGITGIFLRGKEEEFHKVFSDLSMFPSTSMLKQDAQTYWNTFWKKSPSVKIDNKQLEQLYFDSLYRFGSATAADGVAPGLQGCWLEDEKLPPWSGDYHFNINVQMCHWPALKANHAENLRPLFDMIWSWRDTLRKNAEFFVGIPNGYMLPHAVDDKGTCMGNFWPGTIDHGAATWIAKMMFDYCDFTGNIQYLRDVVFEFMRGTMEVWKSMISYEGDGQMSLPLSVSPEYRAAEINAWGKNSSFHLAAVHSLAKCLKRAAKWLDILPDPFWEQVCRQLPQVSVLTENGGGEIAIWNGEFLEESHRHHSHLAGICPFDIINPNSKTWYDVVKNSRNRLMELGMSKWAGWSLPWAAMLCIRMGNGELAELLLQIWKHAFTNKGNNSLHNARYTGLTIFTKEQFGEIMQLDGMMGVLTAIQDMLLYTCSGVIHPFAGIPRHWAYASFTEMPGSGGFMVSGKYKANHYCTLTIRATRKNILRLVLPFHNKWSIAGEKEIIPKNFLNRTLQAGEMLQLRMIPDNNV